MLLGVVLFSCGGGFVLGFSYRLDHGFMDEFRGAYPVVPFKGRDKSSVSVPFGDDVGETIGFPSILNFNKGSFVHG